MYSLSFYTEGIIGNLKRNELFGILDIFKSVVEELGTASYCNISNNISDYIESIEEFNHYFYLDSWEKATIEIIINEKSYEYTILVDHICLEKEFIGSNGSYIVAYNIKLNSKGMKCPSINIPIMISYPLNGADFNMNKISRIDESIIAMRINESYVYKPDTFIDKDLKWFLQFLLSNADSLIKTYERLTEGEWNSYSSSDNDYEDYDYYYNDYEYYYDDYEGYYDEYDFIRSIK